MDFLNLNKQRFFKSLPAKCSYIPNKHEQRIFIKLKENQDDFFYQLMNYGFRRNYSHMYLPACSECKSCISCRIKISGFKLKKNQKRNLSKNKNLKFINALSSDIKNRYDLFKKYIIHRHPEGQMKIMSEDEFNEFFYKSPVKNSIFDVIDENRRYLGSILLDNVELGFSAVYSFYDPEDYKKGLGNYMILKTIDEIKSQNMEYLYLGYWIKESRKMNYKSNFNNLQILIDGKWKFKDFA